MNTNRPILQAASLVLGLIATLSLRDSSAFAQSTAFTYQGRLSENGAKAVGNYDLRFAVFGDAAGGNRRGAAITNSPVAVSNGWFTVALDFGAGVLNGDDLWLEIGVRTNRPDPPGFTTLSPRQPLTATPYAVRAANATSFTGGVSDSQLSANIARLDANQTFSGAVSFSNESNNFSGSFSGNGAALSNAPYSQDHTGYINARDWGAVGNGEVDDTAALQSAIDYMWTTSATNKTLYIPSGRYLVSGLYIPPDDHSGGIGRGEVGHQIYGAGCGVTMLDFSQSPNAVGISMTNGMNSGVIISGLRLIGPEGIAAQPTHTSKGICIGTYDGLVEPFKIRIRDCELTGWVTGITASNCWQIEISGCSIGYVTSYGIEFCGAHATRVDQTDISGHHNEPLSPTAPYAHGGIAYLGDLGGNSGVGDDATIINCMFDAFTNAILNEGDVCLGVYSTHAERAGSFYTCTNDGAWGGVVMVNVYMLDNDPVIETSYPAQINLNSESSRSSSFIDCLPSRHERPVIAITDNTGCGYHPPTIISGGEFPITYNGAAKTVYPVTYYLEHGITTNMLVAAPGDKTNLLQFSYGVLTNVADHY